MFAGDEVVLDLSYATACAGLSEFARSDLLVAAAQCAYAEGAACLQAVIPSPGPSRMAELRVLPRAGTAGMSGLVIRWEAIGPRGELFAALDADLGLAPAGGQATVLTLAAAYRTPPGTTGAEVNRVLTRRAAATAVRSFARRIAEGIAGQAGTASRRSTGNGPAGEPG